MNKKRERQQKALDRLENQLAFGTKTNDGVTTELTEKDKKRINKEIEILNKKI